MAMETVGDHEKLLVVELQELRAREADMPLQFRRIDRMKAGNLKENLINLLWLTGNMSYCEDGKGILDRLSEAEKESRRLYELRMSRPEPASEDERWASYWAIEKDQWDVVDDLLLHRAGCEVCQQHQNDRPS